MFKDRVADIKILVKARKTFFEYGYLLPAALPLMYILGRGVYNALGVVYLLWALAALPESWPKVDRRLKILFFLLYFSFLLGAPFAINSGRAFESWGIYVANTLAFFFTLAAFQKEEGRLEKFMRCLAYVALVTPIALFVKAGLMTGDWGTLIAKRSWQETSLPFLSMFLLWFLLDRRFPWRYAACVLVSGITFGYVVASDGRSALVALICAMSFFSLAVFRFKFRYFVVALLVVGIVLASPAADGIVIREWPKDQTDVVKIIDSVSSLRTVFWRQAIENPPENSLVGVGIGNVRYYGDVIGINGKPHSKHLHNLFLDLWYETGLFGLASFLAVNFFVLWPARRQYISASLTEKLKIGTVVSALVAIFIAGLFSIGYTSPHFKMYLFMLLACLVYMQSKEKLDVRGK